MNKVKITIYLCLILIIHGCNSKFDKTGWLEQNDIQQYPNRDKMLNDLLNNYKLKDLSYSQLVELLGSPAENWVGEMGEVFYPIVIDYGFNIDPVYSKTLVIKLNADSIVTDFKVNEKDN